MRAGDAPPGWYVTPMGRRLRVIGPSDDPRYAWAEDAGGRRLELPVRVDLTPDAPPADELTPIAVLPRGTCACCGWSGDLVRRERAGGPVWALPTHADREELCQGTGRTPPETELLATPDVGSDELWGSARTTVERVAVVRATSDLAWLDRAYAQGDALQANVRLELLGQRDALDRVRALVGDAPRLRAHRRRSDVRARPGVRAALERLLTEATAADEARREAAAKARAMEARFRRGSGGLAPPPGLIPVVEEPVGPDPVLEVLARDAASAVAQLVAADLEALDDEARRVLAEQARCPLTALDWTVERLAVVLSWGHPLTPIGVLAASRSLARSAADPTSWVRRLDPETLSHVLFAAAGRVSEMADPPAGGRVVRALALASLSPLAPESAGVLAVRALRSLWGVGVRAKLILETE